MFRTQKVEYYTESLPPTASQLVQLFLQGSPVCRTDSHTDHRMYDVCRNRLHLCDAAKYLLKRHMLFNFLRLLWHFGTVLYVCTVQIWKIFVIINTKNCSLSTVLMASDRKPQKSFKGDITHHHIAWTSPPKWGAISMKPPKGNTLVRISDVWAIKRENPSTGLTCRWVREKGINK